MMRFFFRLAVIGIWTTCCPAAEPAIAIQAKSYQGKADRTEMDGGQVFRFCCGGSGEHLAVSLPEDSALSYSWSAWVSPDGIPQNIKRFTAVSDRTSELAYNATRQFEFTVRGEHDAVASAVSPKLASDRWYHVVGVCDAKTREARIYVNGKRLGTARLPDGMKAPQGTAYIGCTDPKKPDGWFNGYLDDIAFFRRALSDGEAARMYRQASSRHPVQELSGALLPQNAIGDSSGGKLLPAFTEDAVSSARFEALKRNIPGQLQKYEVELAAVRTKLNGCFGARESLQRERTLVRQEIAEGLPGFIRRNLERGDRDGVLFAAMAMADLSVLLRYFDEEIGLWKTFPREATGEDPGNQPVIFDFKKDFGGHGDGVTDESPAMRTAMTAMGKLNGKPAILKIPAGTYLFRDPNAKKEDWANVTIGPLENAVVEGESPEATTFVFGLYDKKGIVFSHCRNTSIRNLTLRTAEIPFCQGEIIDLDVKNATVTIQHDSRTMRPDDRKFAENSYFQCCTAYQPDGSIVRTQFICWNHGEVKDLGDGKFRIQMDPKYSLEHLRKGLIFVLPDRIYPAGCFLMDDTEFCNAENIHIRASYAGAFGTNVARWSSWYRCKVFPQAGMMLASNADVWMGLAGAYLSGFEATNPGDDCFNAYTPGYNIAMIDGRRASPGRIHGLQTPGSLRVFMSMRTGQYLSLNEVRECSDSWSSVFADPIPPGVRSVEQISKRPHIEIPGGPRDLVRYDDVPDVTNDSRVTGVGTVIRNSRFANSRSGANMQAPCSLLENNVFENIAMGTAIRVGSLTHEGTPPYHVMIRNNVVKNSFAGILAQRFIANGQSALCAPIHGITIENNRIGDVTFNLWLQNVSDAVIRGNRFTGIPLNAFHEQSDRILFERCRDIDLSGNFLNGGKLEKKDCEFSACEGQTAVR